MSALKNTSFERKTKVLPFFKCNADEQMLFAVQSGVPVGDAMDWGSCFLESAISILEGIEDSSEVYAARYLVVMAKAAFNAAGMAIVGSPESEADHD